MSNELFSVYHFTFKANQPSEIKSNIAPRIPAQSAGIGSIGPVQRKKAESTQLMEIHLDNFYFAKKLH